MNNLQTLIGKIEAKSSYEAHVVLDGGKTKVLVLANNKWYLHSDCKWNEVSKDEAFELAEKFYLTSTFEKIVK